jgi:hypothetical protein
LKIKNLPQLTPGRKIIDVCLGAIAILFTIAVAEGYGWRGALVAVAVVYLFMAWRHKSWWF